MATVLEGVQAMLRGEAPGPPVARLIGFRWFRSRRAERSSRWKPALKTPTRWERFTVGFFATSPV
jgi:hypothetical protein